MLLTLTAANIVTQCFLWLVLSVFFNSYWIALLTTEILIVLAEALAFVMVKSNRCGYREALILSLLLNSFSFGAGLFMPV